MINKECILDSTGGIRKDFAKRGIPQYSNNYVHVNFLIPQDVFTELDNYTVQVAASITAQSQTTVLPTLYAFASKTLKIDDINYIKYSVVLSSIYTEKRGALKLSPSVYEVRQTTVENQLTTQLINRKAYVYTQLDVVESVDATYDNSLDNPTIAVALSNAIDSKHISDIDVDGASIAEIAYNVATDYSTPYYNGWILMNKAKKQMFIPYIGTGDEENLFYLDYKNGIMYDITNITASSSTPISYSCDIKQLNFSKEEVETLLSDKLTDVEYASGYFTKTKYDHLNDEDITEEIVDVNTLADDMGFTAHKNNTENPHSVTKTQVGLGNVSDYTISDNPGLDSSYSYASSKALYTGLANKVNLTTFQALNNQVQAISALIGDLDNPDPDSIVNKLTEIIQIFQDYDESAGTVLSILNTKASQTEVTSLSGRVTSLETRVDALDETNYGLIILTPQDDINLLTITPSEFVDNTGSNAEDYPYKTTLISTAFVGVQDFSIVFNEEDGGLFEPICTLNNQTGELTLYCSELPTENIVIVKIRLVKTLAAINGEILSLANRLTAAEGNIDSLVGITNNIQNDYVKKLYQDTADLNKTSKITNNKNEVLVEVSKKIASDSDRLNKSTVQATTDGIVLSNVYNANNEPTQTTSMLIGGWDGLQGHTDRLLSFTKNYYPSDGLDRAYMRIKSNNEKLLLVNEIEDTPTNPNTIPTMTGISLGTNQLNIVYKDKSNNAKQESSIKLYPNYINTKVVSDQGAYTLISQGPNTLGISKNDSSNNGLAGISIFNDATHTLRLYSPKIEFSAPIESNISTGDYYNTEVTNQGIFMNYVTDGVDLDSKPVAIIDDSLATIYTNSTYSRIKIDQRFAGLPSKIYKHNIVMRKTGNTVGCGIITFTLDSTLSSALTLVGVYNELIARGYGDPNATSPTNIEDAKVISASGQARAQVGSFVASGVAVYETGITIYGSIYSDMNMQQRSVHIDYSTLASDWVVSDNNPHY